MNYPRIRYGTLADVEAVRRIAVKQSRYVGFVRHSEILRGIEKRELFVAECDGQIVGFCNWHRRRDGWSTVYALAVSDSQQGQGIGRALLYAVPCPMRLKCMANNPANAFYQHAGMRLTCTGPGRKHALNVYEMNVLTALVAGGSTFMPDVARKSGMAYGVRHTERAQAWPLILDVEWERFKKKPDEWTRYLALVNEYRPVMAMCVDYEYPLQRRELYRQIRDLKTAGVIRVMVCPKFDGAIAHIPSWCVVAVSVPSGYAGFLPDFRELRGRSVHLLGGTPRKQRDIIMKIAGYGGRVISTDGNSHQRASMRGSFYHSGKWNFDPRKAEPLDCYDLAAKSGANIRRELNIAANWKQEPLWQTLD